jgi:hypothetical protein
MSSLVDPECRVRPPAGVPLPAPPAPPPVAAPPPPRPPAATLDLMMQAQQETEWCWAAVSTSIAHYYDGRSPWVQCRLVNEVLSSGRALKKPICCDDPGSAECNQPWKLYDALERVGHLGASHADGPTPQALGAEMAARRPLCLAIAWDGGGGHFVAVDSYDAASGLLEIKDPLFGHSLVHRDSFPRSYQGGGTWAWTYTTK